MNVNQRMMRTFAQVVWRIPPSMICPPFRPYVTEKRHSLCPLMHNVVILSSYFASMKQRSTSSSLLENCSSAERQIEVVQVHRLLLLLLEHGNLSSQEFHSANGPGKKSPAALLLGPSWAFIDRPHTPTRSHGCHLPGADPTRKRYSPVYCYIYNQPYCCMLHLSRGPQPIASK